MMHDTYKSSSKRSIPLLFLTILCIFCASKFLMQLKRVGSGKRVFPPMRASSINCNFLFCFVCECCCVSHIYNPLNAMNMNFSWCFVRIQKKMGHYINSVGHQRIQHRPSNTDWTMEIEKIHSTTVNICQHIKMPFDTTNAAFTDSLDNNHNHISHHIFRLYASFFRSSVCANAHVCDDWANVQNMTERERNT